MNTWKTFNFKENFRHLDNTIEVKLHNNKVVSIWNIVGVTPLDKKGEEINVDNIGWFRAKKNLNRFNKLQKHYETLSHLDRDGDILDNIDWAISDSLKIQFGEGEDLKKAFETIRDYIEKAQQQILTESKTFLQ